MGLINGAGNRIRTGDPDLGKVVLYQLSYSRFGGVELFIVNGDACYRDLEQL